MCIDKAPTKSIHDLSAHLLLFSSVKMQKQNMGHSKRQKLKRNNWGNKSPVLNFLKSKTAGGCVCSLPLLQTATLQSPLKQSQLSVFWHAAASTCAHAWSPWWVQLISPQHHGKGHIADKGMPGGALCQINSFSWCLLPLQVTKMAQFKNIFLNTIFFPKWL